MTLCRLGRSAILSKIELDIFENPNLYPSGVKFPELFAFLTLVLHEGPQQSDAAIAANGNAASNVFVKPPCCGQSKMDGMNCSQSFHIVAFLY
jgi:hypothetical protein